MSNIVQILSNVKHNGTEYLRGQFVEVSSELSDIIESGAAKLLRGVSTVEEAVALYSEEETEEIPVVQAENTWEAQPDPVEPVADETKTTTEEIKAPVVEEDKKQPVEVKVADVIDDTKL